MAFAPPRQSETAGTKVESDTIKGSTETSFPPFSSSSKDHMRNLSLSEGDLSSAQNDMDEQMAYTYMLLRMTSDSEHTDELLYKYLNNFTSLTGIQLPAFMVRALFEVQIISHETNSSIFAQFMDSMIHKMNNISIRNNPAKFYAVLGKNLCHLGTVMRTMSAILADQESEGDARVSMTTAGASGKLSSEESDDELYSALQIPDTNPGCSGKQCQ
ncbi:uncharacterized protein LOC129601026 [Paramacrobiotus metropolitanus]|uniref:uncharacterized protein LOC129601026 n=1 Tax=Paramacrobiotus metropolitanus TaxID=2943436 RepID=UPI0024456A99|nr:uncharacterized protein LOC129601026 [Paramacrobiotus metropolitanus]XP_055355709.1 uncharacterized protein LOC129601026 [Paramacrobiotus metropolitanus]